MAYTKPVIVAQNGAAGVYAAGCPAKGSGGNCIGTCKGCERTS